MLGISAALYAFFQEFPALPETFNDGCFLLLHRLQFLSSPE